MNHPERGTRVRCSNCGNPICVACMRETPVGMKCPDCARQPLRVRFGKPRHYLAAAGSGLGAAVAAGALMSLIRFGIFLALLAGLGIGEVMRRTSGHQALPGIGAIAVTVTVVGLSFGTMLAGSPPAALVSGGWLLTAGIAGAMALFRVRA